jgi:hypothetical protein
VAFIEKQRSYLVRFRHDKDADMKFVRGDSIGDKEKPVNFLLLGDSHAHTLSNLFGRLAAKQEIAGRYIGSVSSPFPNTWFGKPPFSNIWDEEKNSFAVGSPIMPNMLAEGNAFAVCWPIMEKDRYRYEKIYLAMRWPYLLYGDLPTPGGRKLYYRKNGGRLYGGAEALYLGLCDLMELFREKGAGTVQLVLPLPETQISVPQNAAWMALYHTEDEINKKIGMSTNAYMGRNREVLEILRKIAKKYPFVKLLDPAPLFRRPDGRGYVVAEGGRSLYSDNNHLSGFGVDKLAPLFDVP